MSSKPKRRRGESVEYSLSPHQVEQVLAVCLDIDERLTIGCPIFLGLRVGELAHLRPEWITQEGDLKIPTRMTCNCAACAKSKGGVWTPKTRAGARTLPIPKRLRKDLTEILRLRPLGVPGSMGVSRVGLYYRTKVILSRAKVKFPGVASNTAFPHSLRSTCAMMLALSGMTEIALCYAMGWADIKVASSYIKAARAGDLARKQMRDAFG